MPRSSVDRHVALLRGVNVGGKHRLPMADLRVLFDEAGAREVTTYIQSGNVAFSAPATRARVITAAVANAIEARFGFRAPIVHRSAAALGALFDENPFLAAGAPAASLHVGFLAEAPSPAAVARLDAARSPGDSFSVRGGEVYLHLPNGVARTKLTNAYFDAQLATVTTVRSWATVLALAAHVR